ncbi:MAG: type II toxin-antitoxin system VapC family toxin [Methanoregula sp.]|nr:type II toxin-antitoxin system VapC family toxin [Methanoregula sp.]
MTIVDTGFLIDLMKGDSGAEQIALDNKQLKTTAISSAEFLTGAKRNDKKTVYEISEKFIRFFPVLPFDAESAVVYARIAHTLSGTASHISTSNELIAAIAIRNNEPLVTRDQHFSAIEGLDIIAY